MQIATVRCSSKGKVSLLFFSFLFLKRAQAEVTESRNRSFGDFGLFIFFGKQKIISKPLKILVIFKNGFSCLEFINDF